MGEKIKRYENLDEIVKIVTLPGENLLSSNPIKIH